MSTIGTGCRTFVSDSVVVSLLYRESRALLRLVADRDLGRHLGERRRAILDEMDRAVARVPEPVLAGREEPRT